MTLRLMSYNVKGLQQDGRAVAEVVRAERPDVLAVQEPPRGPLGWWRLHRFARRTGLRVVVGGRGARTTALLASPGLAVTHAHALPLPWQAGTVRRGVALARVEGVVVVAVHLSLDRAERLRHLDVLDAHLARAQRPLVLVGDLNEQPGGPTWQRLLGSGTPGGVGGAGGTAGAQAGLAGLLDAAPDGPPTYPAVDARHRIDVVLHDAGVRVVAAHVRDDALVHRASDHRPLVVDLAPGPGPTGV
ncbi:hypothetical protein GXP71_12095 [Cellulomonas sp. H30R-01]|uniref:endonuclease/exonuclease/phosphatase family protein n=1 Tax=Cellulomonas sp. H30R-01 TaxID=2704467 RepID=UPI00138B2C07|nr:endonuclease/exonuclease/phosphatase family protein [Cellulomonas sp. H30R-01]QHT56748.1 hypothetical protein GXP71_12095 [Cellulomonas sp. H30R-01]